MDSVKRLLKEGVDIDDVLNELSLYTSEAILLQARWNSGFKQYNMGLIASSEWEIIKKQIEFAINQIVQNYDRQ